MPFVASESGSLHAMSRKRGRSKREREKRWREQQRARRTERTKAPLPPKATRPPAPWITDESLPCPCGSGRSFAACCKPNIPEEPKIVNDFSEDDPVIAERAWRGALTKYLGYVFQNTLPMLKAGHPFGGMAVPIDVEAVEDTVERVVMCMRAQGPSRAAEAVGFFDHIAQSVPLPGLASRILTMKAVWLDSILDDPEGAKSLLADVDPMKATDVHLLEAYVDIVGPSPAQAVQIADRAWKLATKSVDRLFNATSKAFDLILLGDIAGASKTMADALAQNKPPGIGATDRREKYVIARAFSIKWKVDQQPDDLSAAFRWFDAIPLDDLSDVGQASIYHQTGSLLGDSGDHSAAINRLERALQLDATQATRIRLADEYIRANQTKKAREMLSVLDSGAVEPSLRLEYLSLLAMLAVADKDQAAVRAAIKSLQELDIPDLYFREQRNGVCLDLLNLLDREAGNWKNTVNAGLKLRLLAKLAALCNYLELKPNFLGLGVNINRIVEDADAKARASLQRRPQE